MRTIIRFENKLWRLKRKTFRINSFSAVGMWQAGPTSENHFFAARRVINKKLYHSVCLFMLDVAWMSMV